MELWSILLAQYHADDPDWKFTIHVHEDNTPAIQGARTAKNPSHKTLERGFGVSLGWINEKITSGDYDLMSTSTLDMSADIYTKGFRDVALWNRLRKFINVYSPTEIEHFDVNPVMLVRDPPVEVPEGSLNSQFFYVMSGDSTNNDHRKPVKLKQKKKKGKKPPTVRPQPNKAAVGNPGSRALALHPAAFSPGGAQNDRDVQTADDREPSWVVCADCCREPSCVQPRADQKWTVILLCTDPESYMQVLNPYLDNCDVIDITAQDDFTSKDGYNKVLDLCLNIDKVALLVAFPCTGGCWFNVGINSHNPKCSKTLLKHEVLFSKLWRNFERLCHHIGPVPIILEWPTSCTYWRNIRVQRLLKNMALERVNFHGCQFGLKSIRPEHEDMFLKKPWTFATNIPEIIPMFRRLCDDSHTHDKTNGINAIASQYYTPEIVNQIHLSIFQHLFPSPK